MTFLDAQNFAMVRPLEYTSTASTGGGGCMSLIVGAVVFFLFVAVMQPASRGWYPLGRGVAAMKAATDSKPEASHHTQEKTHSSSGFKEVDDDALQTLYDADSKKVVIVYAAWCSHCAKLLNGLPNKYKDHVVLADGDKCKSLSGNGGLFKCEYYPTILVTGHGNCKEVSSVEVGVTHVTDNGGSVASGLATLWATQFSPGASS